MNWFLKKQLIIFALQIESILLKTTDTLGFVSSKPAEWCVFVNTNKRALKQDHYVVMMQIQASIVFDDKTMLQMSNT